MECKKIQSFSFKDDKISSRNILGYFVDCNIVVQLKEFALTCTQMAIISANGGSDLRGYSPLKAGSTIVASASIS